MLRGIALSAVLLFLGQFANAATIYQSPGYSAVATGCQGSSCRGAYSDIEGVGTIASERWCPGQDYNVNGAGVIGDTDSTASLRLAIYADASGEPSTLITDQPLVGPSIVSNDLIRSVYEDGTIASAIDVQSGLCYHLSVYEDTVNKRFNIGRTTGKYRYKTTANPIWAFTDPTEAVTASLAIEVYGQPTSASPLRLYLQGSSSAGWAEGQVGQPTDFYNQKVTSLPVDPQSDAVTSYLQFQTRIDGGATESTTGSGGAYAVNPGIAPISPFDEVAFIPNHTATGPATLNVDGQGAAPIIDIRGNPVDASEFIAAAPAPNNDGVSHEVYWDGSSWVLNEFFGQIDMGKKANTEPYSHHVMEFDASTPLRAWTARTTFNGVSNDFFTPDCDQIFMPFVPGGRIQNNFSYSCIVDGDCHLLTVNPATGEIREQYRSFNVGAGGPSVPEYSGGCSVLWDGASDIDPQLSAREHCTSSTAAGLPYVPFLITPGEIKVGEIKHALAFTLLNSWVERDTFMPPATHTPLLNAFNLPSTSPGPGSPMVYGSRFRLNASFAIDPTWPPALKVILVALKEYGMVHIDGGPRLIVASNDFFDAGAWTDSDVNLNPFDISVGAANLQWTDFELISDSSTKVVKQACSRTQMNEF